MRPQCIACVVVFLSVAATPTTQPTFRSLDEMLSVVPQKFLPDGNIGWTDYEISFDNQILKKDATGRDCELNTVVNNVVSPDMAMRALFGATQPTEPERVQITTEPIYVKQCKCDLIINLDTQDDRAFVDELPLLHQGDSLRVNGRITKAEFVRDVEFINGGSSARAEITVQAKSAKRLPHPATQPTNR